jgi:hypothetical protein
MVAVARAGVAALAAVARAGVAATAAVKATATVAAMAGMMGQGQQGWRMGPGYGGPGQQLNLSTDDAQSYFERQLAAGDNKRLKVGRVKALDDNTIEAQIVTVDGSLVETYRVDRHTGAIAPSGRETIRSVQRTLNQLGYRAGPEDGIMGPQTRRAISAYQARTGMEPHGMLTPDLVDRMTAGSTGRNAN